MAEKPFVAAKGKMSYRQGVKPPWYEIKVTGADGKVTKIVGKVVDKFLSEEWEQEGAKL